MAEFSDRRLHRDDYRKIRPRIPYIIDGRVHFDVYLRNTFSPISRGPVFVFQIYYYIIFIYILLCYNTRYAGSFPSGVSVVCALRAH